METYMRMYVCIYILHVYIFTVCVRARACVRVYMTSIALGLQDELNSKPVFMVTMCVSVCLCVCVCVCLTSIAIGTLNELKTNPEVMATHGLFHEIEVGIVPHRRHRSAPHSAHMLRLRVVRRALHRREAAALDDGEAHLNIRCTIYVTIHNI